MVRIPLILVTGAEEDGRTVVDVVGTLAAGGRVDVEYVCPGCGRALFRGLEPPGVGRVAYRCPDCGTLGRFPSRRQQSP